MSNVLKLRKDNLDREINQIVNSRISGSLEVFLFEVFKIRKVIQRIFFMELFFILRLDGLFFFLEIILNNCLYL